jgi:hypothetical protein
MDNDYFRIDENGLFHIDSDGFLHSENDKPACIKKIGKMLMEIEWYKHGKLHRNGDKPAVFGPHYKEWHRDGHRYKDKFFYTKEDNDLYRKCKEEIERKNENE